MKIFLDKWAFAPERAHDNDAGLDIRTPTSVTVPARGSAVIKTGVHVELSLFDTGRGICFTAGVLMAKSGLNVNHGVLSDGLIDYGYNGEIVVKLYNHSDESYTFAAGDKITQLVIIPVLTPNVEIVHNIEELSASERGNAGFGSTGR